MDYWFILEGIKFEKNIIKLIVPWWWDVCCQRYASIVILESSYNSTYKMIIISVCRRRWIKIYVREQRHVTAVIH